MDRRTGRTPPKRRLIAAQPKVAIGWGAIALGAMAGIGAALLAFLFLGATGLADAGNWAATLVFLQYLAQVAGGYLAGRLAPASRAFHGGMAGLLMAAVGAAIGLGFAGNESNLGLVVLALVVAITAGSAGGALAEYQLHR